MLSIIHIYCSIHDLTIYSNLMKVNEKIVVREKYLHSGSDRMHSKHTSFTDSIPAQPIYSSSVKLSLTLSLCVIREQPSFQLRNNLLDKRSRLRRITSI